MFKIYMERVIKICIIISILATHFYVAISQIGEVLAAEKENNKDTQTNVEGIFFDAYFLTETGEITYTSEKEIKTGNTLYLKLQSHNKGYIKNIKISFQNQKGEKNTNFVFQKSENSQIIEQDLDNQTIQLQQVNKAETQIVPVIINMNEQEQLDPQDFSKDSIVHLEAIYTNLQGKEIKIEKDCTITVKWKSDVELDLQQDIVKYIPYEQGVLLQTKIYSGIKDNLLPIKNTEIQVNVPELYGIKPEEIRVYSNGTGATNGDQKAIEFTEENWEYDKEKNIIKIKVENKENEDRKISWKKGNIKDEYAISYHYPKELLEKLQQENEIKLYSKSNITMYSSEEISQEKIEEKDVILSTQMGKFVEFQIQTANTELEKGYLYANSISPQNNYMTTDTYEIITEISYANYVDSIILQDDKEYFNGKQEEVFEVKPNYKSLHVDKQRMNKLLGQQGKIELIDESGNILYEINSETTEKNGYYEIELDQMQINKIKIKTSKPITEGILSLKITKQLTKEIGYTKEQIQDFTKYNTQIKAILEKESLELQNELLQKQVTLKEPITKIITEINKENLSTAINNEDVFINIKLVNDSEKYALFQDPIIEIELPSSIEQIEVKNTYLLRDEELAITSAQLFETAEGKKTIRLELKGIQTKYHLGELSNSNIVIQCNIKLKPETAKGNDKIVVYYQNQQNSIYENSIIEGYGYSEIPIEYVVPSGLTTINGVENYGVDKNMVVSISGNESKGILEVQENSQIAKMHMNIVNQYENILTNIKILGRIPFSNNKSIQTGEDLGSNIDTIMQGAIQAEGIDLSKATVYYSTEPEASKDITDQENKWTTNPDFSQVKSFLIDLKDYEMKPKEVLRFTYDVKIPENLVYGQSTYGTYVVYFDNKMDNINIPQVEEAPAIQLGTQEEAKLKLTMESDVGVEVQNKEGKIITYKMIVENIGEVEATNVIMETSVPDGMSHMEFKLDSYSGNQGQYVATGKEIITNRVDKIAPGEKVEYEYLLRVDTITSKQICSNNEHYIEINGEMIHADSIYKHDDSEYQREIENSFTVEAKNLNKPLKSDILKTKVKKAYFSISIKAEPNVLQTVKKGDEITYTATINSKQTEEMKDVIAEIDLQKEVEYIEGYFETDNNEKQEATYDKKSGKIKWNIGNLKEQGEVKITLKIKVGDLPEEQQEGSIKVIAKVVAKNIEEHESMQITHKIKKEIITISQKTNIQEGSIINPGDVIRYTIQVENKGGASTNNLKLTDKIPDEIRIVKIKYKFITGENIRNEITIPNTGNNQVEISEILRGGEILEVEITGEVKSLTDGTTKKEIVNYATVKTDVTNELKSNETRHIIEDFGEDNPNFEGRHRISGVAWIDENENGIKEENEARLSGVEVLLINANNSQIQQDEITGEGMRTTTDENGRYVFSNLKDGEYYVVFAYDTSNYRTTLYQKGEEEENSDVMETNIQLNGEKRKVGITDTIKIKDSNIYNIDIGLIKTPQFDFRLEKFVSNITVKNNTGTKTYSYGESKLAKRELIAGELNNTNLIIEYKIKITNEGQIDGYVKKVIDYMPKELKFNSEINPNWYADNDGNLYNSSLANQKILAGETKEIVLRLTKKMDENSTGTIQNTAEIYEAYNDFGVTDRDSSPGNKKQGEDDMSSADIILTIRTGKAISYILISFGVITLLGIGIYEIRKKVLVK